MELGVQRPEDAATQEVNRFQRVVGLVILAAALAALIWLAIAILPDHSPPLGAIRVGSITSSTTGG
jgi:hypothetical protein